MDTGWEGPNGSVKMVWLSWTQQARGTRGPAKEGVRSQAKAGRQVLTVETLCTAPHPHEDAVTGRGHSWSTRLGVAATPLGLLV